MKKITNKQFIERARAVHGNKYDYTKSEYLGWDAKIEITCMVHGGFKQSAGNHLVGKGCNECAKVNIGNALRGSKSNFIKKAKTQHGDKYLYADVEYSTARKKVKIVCPEHGHFLQTPDSHVRGSGCPVCANRDVGLASRMQEVEFIERATSIHNDKYVYEYVEYVNTKTGVKIKCPEHGLFIQSPGNHLSGNGCPVCAGHISMTTDDFVRRAAIIHNDKYSYDLAKVIDCKTKVLISCPEHVLFKQSPSNHLKGHGCPACGGREKLTTEEFISRSNKVHGDKYLYDKIKYINTKTKLTITCKKHGLFAQVPDSHLAGNGCPTCSGSIRITTESFIARAKTVHNDFYGYKSVDVSGGRVKVRITCPLHGDFNQAPTEHLLGRGCLKCGKERTANILKMNKDDYIDRASEIHGGKYDYSRICYKNNRDKIIIICPEHGLFTQRAGNHISGIGCPGCASGGFDQTKPAILYYLRVETRTHLLWKIGITNRTVYERFFGEDAKKITILKTWHYDSGREAMLREKKVLKEFDEFRYRGLNRILNLFGDTELFTSDVLGLDGNS